MASQHVDEMEMEIKKCSQISEPSMNYKGHPWVGKKPRQRGQWIK